MTRPATAAQEQEPGDLVFPYDGRFAFLRIRYASNLSSRSFRWGRSRDPGWHHDYPRAESHLMKIIEETTTMEPHQGGGNILDLDDPALFRYPVAYLSEPGDWYPSEAEVEGLRNYLLKGGFLIVDDFRGDDFYNFHRQIQRVLPQAQIVQLDASHPIFHSFFEITSLDFVPKYDRFPLFLGIFEDDDPEGRMMMIINYNNDVGEYWEWSDDGFTPIELSNEAYKLGVNYLVYGLTH